MDIKKVYESDYNSIHIFRYQGKKYFFRTYLELQQSGTTLCNEVKEQLTVEDF